MNINKSYYRCFHLGISAEKIISKYYVYFTVLTYFDPVSVGGGNVVNSFVFLKSLVRELFVELKYLPLINTAD